ncbi:hypothetical protein EM82_021065 [Vibrio parahaemolyticus]|nr:hypothetical protein EM82_021065 [Vibrio parahaemolyticus]ODY22729.1 hypothetical protein BBM16_02950 [Vibrio parahaemolyticus]
MSVPSFSGLLFISPKHHLKATLRFQLAVSYNWHIEKQPKSALAHSPPRAAPWAFTCEMYIIPHALKIGQIPQ